MATAATIRDMAATRLGILGEGEILPSYETADMDQSYVEVHAKLSSLNIVVWDFDEDIPDEYVDDVVNLTAFGRINDYGIPNDRYSRLMTVVGIRGEGAYGNIKELKGGDTYVTPTPDYF